MPPPAEGSPRWRAGAETNKLVKIGCAVSRAESADERAQRCREAAGQAEVCAQAWRAAAAAAQLEFEQERRDAP